MKEICQHCIMWRVWWTGLSLTTRNLLYNCNRDPADTKNKWIESAHTGLFFLSSYLAQHFSNLYCTILLPIFTAYCQCFKTNINKNTWLNIILIKNIYWLDFVHFELIGSWPHASKRVIREDNIYWKLIWFKVMRACE